MLLPLKEVKEINLKLDSELVKLKLEVANLKEQHSVCSYSGMQLPAASGVITGNGEGFTIHRKNPSKPESEKLNTKIGSTISKISSGKSTSESSLSVSKPMGDADVDQEGFQEVRRRKPRKILVGNNNAGGLSVAPKQAYIHIWRLAKDTTVEYLVTYIKQKIPGTEVECEKLNARGPYASFKVTVNDSLLEHLMNPECWPAGCAIDRFFNRRPNTPRLA